ncbi:hypothetical protein JCM12141A_38300 [Mycolicibacterium hodleri]
MSGDAAGVLVSGVAGDSSSSTSADGASAVRVSAVIGAALSFKRSPTASGQAGAPLEHAFDPLACSGADTSGGSVKGVVVAMQTLVRVTAGGFSW